MPDLPQQLQQQIEKTAPLRERLKAAADGTEPASTETDAAPEPPAAEAVVTDASPEESATPEVSFEPPPIAPPAQPPASPEGTTPEDPPAAATTTETVESLRAQLVAKDQQYAQLNQAHSALKQKYNSEVPRLQSFVKDKDADLRELRSRNELLLSQQQSAEATQTPDVPAQPAPAGGLKTRPEEITDADVDAEIPEEQIKDFGYDYWRTVMAGWNRRATSPELLQRLEQTESDLAREQERAQQHAVDAFHRQLDQLAPDWRAVDDDPAFELWLPTQQDPLSGLTYDQCYSLAVGDLDAKRIAELIRRWQSSQNPSAPEPVPLPSVKSQVEQQPKAPQPAPAQPTFTLERIREIRTNITKGGVYTPARAAELESQIQAAIRDGRVTGMPAQPNL